MFVNFAVLWLFAKVFSTKFGGMASFGVAQMSNLHRGNHIFHQSAKVFSLESFLLYGIALEQINVNQCCILNSSALKRIDFYQARPPKELVDYI